MKAKIYDFGPSLRIFFDDDNPCQQGFTHKDNKHPKSGTGFMHLLKDGPASIRAMKFGYEQGARYFEMYDDIDDDTPRTYDFNYNHREVKWCNDCKDKSLFIINESQDPVYKDGERLKECSICGRYEEKLDMPVTECCGKYILYEQIGVDEYQRWDFCSKCLEPFHTIKESEFESKTTN